LDSRPAKGKEDAAQSRAAQIPAQILEKANDQLASQAKKIDLLIAAVEEWVLKQVEASEAGIRRVDNSGPGDRQGLSEDRLGPRFAIKAPTASPVNDKPIVAVKPSATAGPQAPLTEKAATELPNGHGAKASDSADGGASKDILNPPLLGRSVPANPPLHDPALSSKTAAEIYAADAADGKNKSDASRVDVAQITMGPRRENARPWWMVAGRDSGKGTDASRIDPLKSLQLEKPPDNNKGLFTRLAELISKAERIFNQKPDFMMNEQTGSEPQAVNRPLFQVTLLEPQTLANSGSQPAVKPDVALLIEDIQQTIDDSGRQSMMSVRIRLHPPELGHLVVEFRRDDNGMRIEFHTPHPAVQKALEDAGPKMIERLSQSGVDVGSLDVFLSNNGADGRKTYSPLDDPANRPGLTAGGIGGETASQGGIALNATPLLYFADDSSRVDLLI
jgi:hypothetical protein